MNATTTTYKRTADVANNAVNNVINSVNSNSMENVFETLPFYGNNWECLEVRYFNERELASITKAEVRASEFGRSMCFFMSNGKKTFIPIDKESTLNIGDEVEPDKVQLKKLKNISDAHAEIGKIILRVDIEPEGNDGELDFDNPLGI